MAQRRMFSKSITNSSNFLMMPQSAQNLYFHLGMNADDDGFCEHFTVMRMTESKPDDLKILQAKGFIHVFDDRILIVTDWRENNYIPKDRYTPSKYLSIYKKEIKLLSECPGNKIKCIQNVYKMETQVRIDKDSTILSKDSIEDNTVRETRTVLATQPPPPPIIGKENSKKDLKPLIPEESNKKVIEMFNNQRQHIKILSLYFQKKKFIFPNNEVLQQAIKRDTKTASQLVGYPLDDITGTMDWLDKNSKNFEWKLETVFKRIDNYRAAWHEYNKSKQK